MRPPHPRPALIATAIGLVAALAAPLPALATPVTPHAGAPTSSDSITGPLQNSKKSTFLALDTNAVTRNTWWDRATTPGTVTYPAPGKSGPVVIDGTCMPASMDPSVVQNYAIPFNDPNDCLQFDSELTTEGYFTFVVDMPGAAADGRYLGDGNSGGWLDLLSTTPLVLFSIPEEPAGSADLAVRTDDTDGDGVITTKDTAVWSASLRNSGNVRLRDLSLTLSNGVPLACDPAVVDAGAVASCESEPVPLTQADIDRGSLEATMTATAKTPSGAAFDFADASARATIAARAAGSTTTTAVGDVPAAGSVIRVTVEVRNDGNVTLHDVSGTVNGGAVDLGSGTLAPGATVRHEFDHTVTQQEFDSGHVEFATAATAKSPTGDRVALAGSDATVDFERQGSVSATLRTVVPSAPGAGDAIRLRLTVTNPGNASIHDLAVEFDKSGLSADCAVPALAPGASVDCDVTGSYAVTQADVDAGTVPFRATVRAVDAAGADVSTEARASQDTVAQAPAVAAVVVPELHIAGTAPVAGDVVALSVRVTNTGNVTLGDIAGSITERSQLRVSCPSQPLLPGAVVTCAVPEYTVTQADIDAGAVDFSAQVSGTGPKQQAVEAADSASVTLDRRHGIVATATAVLAGGSDAPRAGDHVELAVTAHNSGNTTLRDVRAEVEGADLEAACADRPMSPGADVTCTIEDHVLTRAEVDAGVVEFAIRVTADGPAGSRAEASDTVSVELARVPAIEVRATSVLAPNEHEVPVAGDRVHVAMTIRNTGNVTVTGVRGQVSDRDGLDVDCPSDELAAGTDVTCLVSDHTLTQADVDAGSVRFDVTAVATGADRQRVGAATETTLSIVRAPAITATATASLDDTDHDHPAAGDAATVRISIENTGNTTVRDLAATVEHRTGMVTTCDSGSLAPGASTDCTITGYALTQADVDAGTVGFAVTATATGADGTPVSGSATADVAIERVAAVDTTVTAHLAESEHRVPRAGDRVVLAVSAKNTGNVTLRDTDAEFVELADVPVTCGTDAIAPGGTVECAAPEYVLTQSDIERGEVIVAGVLSATGADGTTASDRDVVRVGLRAESGLDVTAQPLLRDRDGRFVPLAQDHVLRPGDELRVRYTVVNTGNLAVSDLQHADDVPALEFDRDGLEPGERATATTTAAHTVSDAEGAAGSVVLVGRVKGQVTRADGDAATAAGGITTGQTGAAEQTGPSARTAVPVAAAGKPVWVFSGLVRTTITAEPTPVVPAPIELAFTGSEITQVALPVGIVLLLAGAVLLVWVRRRRKDTEAGRHRG